MVSGGSSWKPFGTSLESARQLNDHLRHIFHEEEIYRIDHYLGKDRAEYLGIAFLERYFSSHCGIIIISIPSRSALLRP